MEIKQNILTKNECFQSGVAMSPKMLMVHSTATPGAPAKNFLSSWNKARPGGRQVCVHAFVDDTGVYQTLPWRMEAWHCAGSGNDMAIGVELCEPSDYGNRTYFEAVLKNAIQLYAYLSKEYDIPVSKIVSHKEGHAMGIASNHGDPDHWWKYMGYTMDNFRADVQECITSGNIDVTTGSSIPIISGGNASAGNGEEVVFTYAVRAGGRIYPEVTNLNDWAGKGDGVPITGLAIKVNIGSVRYCVHIKGGKWLGWVTGYDWNDYNNGWAGLNSGAEIDAVQVYYHTPDDYAQKWGYQKAQYRVSPIDRTTFYPWQYDTDDTGGQDGYAGVYGKAIDKFQLF